MAVDTQLADRVRELLLAVTEHIEEKKMFGTLAFMVNGKLCIGVKSDQILVRIGPEDFAKAVEAGALQPMEMGSRTSNSFGYVEATEVRTTKQLQRWVDQAMKFNREVPDTKTKPRKPKSPNG